VPDVDAGDAQADAGDAEPDGDAGPGCSQSAQCIDPAAPIYDATDLACRGCQADPECLARDPASTLDHDIDGDPRPQGGGPDIGADERQ
jgi:hypothetical protein